MSEYQQQPGSRRMGVLEWLLDQPATTFERWLAHTVPRDTLIATAWILITLGGAAVAAGLLSALPALLTAQDSGGVSAAVEYLRLAFLALLVVFAATRLLAVTRKITAERS